MPKLPHGSKDPSLMSAGEVMAYLRIGRNSLRALQRSKALVPVRSDKATSWYSRKEVEKRTGGNSPAHVAATALAIASRTELAVRDLVRLSGLDFVPLSSDVKDIIRDYDRVKGFFAHPTDVYERDVQDWSVRYVTITPAHVQIMRDITGDFAVGELYVEFFRRLALTTEEGSIIRGQALRAMHAVQQATYACLDGGAQQVLGKVRQVLLSLDSHPQRTSRTWADH